jgi:hypothetical protein
LDAFAFLHLVVPPLHVGAMVGNCHSQSKAEVAHSDRGDVGDREFFARNEVVLRQLIVELLMESGNPKLATLNQRRDLRDRVNMARQTSVDELGTLQVRCAVYNGALGSGFGNLFEPIPDTVEQLPLAA